MCFWHKIFDVLNLGSYFTRMQDSVAFLTSYILCGYDGYQEQKRPMMDSNQAARIS
jgi:hypothetical protein